MVIEPGFQVRLGTYGLDAEIIGPRPQICGLLAARLDTIVDAYLAHIYRLPCYIVRYGHAVRRDG
jgi:hypothetical protein